MSAAARVDFVVYGPPGAPGLLVEAKRIDRSSPGWATEWRRNLLRDQANRSAQPMLALVTPSRIFVWPAGAPHDAEPTHVLDASAHLRPYFAKSRVLPSTASPEVFERTVSRWLEDLTDPFRVAALPNAARHELERSGLLDALRNARIVKEGMAWW